MMTSVDNDDYVNEMEEEYYQDGDDDDEGPSDWNLS